MAVTRDLEQLRRGQVLQRWTAVATAAWLFFGLLEWWRTGEPTLAVPLLVLSVLSACTLFVREKVDVHSILLAVIVLLGVGVLSFLSGGVQLYLLIWAVLLPLTAALVTRSLQRSVLWGVAITGMVGVLWGLESAGLTPPRLQVPQWLGALVVVAFAWVLTGLAFAYEGTRRRTEAEEIARDESRRERRTLEVVSRFAGGVAHEFNNELTIIQAYAGLAADREQDDEHRAQLTEIIDAAERGAALSREILGLSRHVSEGQDEVELGRLVEALETTGSLAHWAGQGQVRVQAEGGVWVTAVRDELVDVLMNLVLNAGAAVEPGGHITVGVKRDHDAVLWVQDEGSGMAADVVKRAFDPFFTTHALGEAAGLGLSTAQASVRRWGGQVVLTSQPGNGTRVEVRLPLAR